MKILEISAPSKKYNVCIGSGLLSELGEHARALATLGEKAAVITDDNVDALWNEKTVAPLEKAGFQVSKYVLPHGEESKNGLNYLALLSFLAEKGLSRSDVVIALGGGMVGDIAAFAAATYLRGVKFIQLPTSLLAMVDSSVGGKTAIDLPEGKNLAGVFCQPDAVLCDTDTLNTLPKDILRNGCAEVLKYGILESRELFEHLCEKGLDFDREYVVGASVAMKRDYVCADEFDTGLRQMLNLGHTVGHAVEKCSAYALSHGESVAIGIAVIARAAAAADYCSKECAEEIVSTLAALGLPTECKNDIDALMPLMLSDKKRRGSKVNIIVPREIGRCEIAPMTEAELKEFVSKGL